jgi:DNA-binding PadR family transcriptional regulator
VAELSGQKVTLSTSTLYTALGRLLEQGLIERTAEEPEKHPGLPRKAYVLTANGRRVLEAETNRLQELVTAARLRLNEEMA